MIQEKIRAYCNTIGLDTVGFIRCRQFTELKEFYKSRKELSLENEFEEKDIEKRINPNIYMSEGKTIISIAFPYIWCNEKNENGFSVYTKGIDYHRVVNSYLDKICTYINEIGGKALPFVDSNSLPERYIAYLARVGEVGKNNMIITQKYGSYVFLGEIITDLELFSEDYGTFEDIIKFEKCGECTDCVEVCPTKSINIARKNPNICSSYITQKKELTNIDMKLLKNRIFGCDICQNTCPQNHEIEFSKIKEFKPLDFMSTNEVEIFASIDNKFFKEKISKTSCGWRGKNVIKRNAIIKMFNEGKDIEQFKGQSPYINDYVSRLEEIRELEEKI